VDRDASESLRGLILDRLRRLPIRRAVIFGSIARGEEGPGSDVDLFVELNSSPSRGDVELALSELRTEVLARFGNVLSPLVYTRGKSNHPPNPALFRAIESEGLSVIGTSTSNRTRPEARDRPGKFRAIRSGRFRRGKLIKRGP
jgi:predicted nucleotidyltransferase